MDSFTLDKCMDVTKQLGDKTLFSLFRSKKDLKAAFPTLTKADLSSFVDLERIAKNLDVNKYKSKEEWVKDIQGVWMYCIKISANLPLLEAIAKEFRNISYKLILRMPNNEEEANICKAIELIKKLQKLTDNVPHELTGPINVINSHEKLRK